MINLIHGDCLEVLKTIPDESVDAVVTDPPYGILNHKIESGVDIPAFFKECKRVLKPNSFIVFFGRQPTLTTWNSIAFQYFHYKNEVIWYKRQRSSPMDDMGRVFENIMICVKGSRRINQTKRDYADEYESLVEFHGFESLKRYLSRIKYFFATEERYKEAVSFINANEQQVKEFYSYPKSKSNRQSATFHDNSFSYSVPRDLSQIKTIYGTLPKNLISFKPHNLQGYNKDEHNIKHPTVKPIQLMEWLIDLTTLENQVVLDPFMGSGTTGIACRNLNRQFIGIEIDAGYYDIAYQRIHQESQTQVSQEQDATQEITTIQSPKQRSLF